MQQTNKQTLPFYFHLLMYDIRYTHSDETQIYRTTFTFTFTFTYYYFLYSRFCSHHRITCIYIQDGRMSKLLSTTKLCRNKISFTCMSVILISLKCCAFIFAFTQLETGTPVNKYSDTHIHIRILNYSNKTFAYISSTLLCNVQYI